jgi:hypothetical protein
MTEENKIIRINFDTGLQKIINETSKELAETAELAGVVFDIIYCAHCNQPIKKGQSYRRVHGPKGMLSVHQTCLDK